MNERPKIELSPRDRRYLNSPGFESYMIAGVVFALGLGLSLVITVSIHREPLFWPGMILTLIISTVVLQQFKKREYRAKLREIIENPMPDDGRPLHDH